MCSLYTSDIINKLEEASCGLKIKKGDKRKLIFIYTPPKVGSTSLVSSFRICCIKKVHVIHIHDETMLKAIGINSDVSINDIIRYNAYLGRDVWVIDVYRSPIERKMSVFFEKIGSLHFNNDDKIVNNYGLPLVTKRFNNIFEHIGNGDYFLDNFELPNLPDHFDNINNYLLVEKNKVKYIKLRLMDSIKWGSILTKLIGVNIEIVKDYEGENKDIGKIYGNFKKSYKIPNNYLDVIKNDKYLNYYLSESEKNDYIRKWCEKVSENFIGYNSQEYKLYESICLENGVRDVIKVDHYMDEGCICVNCNLKREELRKKVLSKEEIREEKVVHKKTLSEKKPVPNFGIRWL